MAMLILLWILNTFEVMSDRSKDTHHKNKADRHKSRTRNSISHLAKKKVKCDGLTDRRTDGPTDGPTYGPTDRPTQWLIESRARD